MNKELALMLSKKVLRLKEESNGNMTINEALESIVQAYKDSQKLNKTHNYSLTDNDKKFKVGDKYQSTVNYMVGTIKKVKKQEIVFAQYNPFYDYSYPDKSIEIAIVEDLMNRGLLIKIRR